MKPLDKARIINHEDAGQASGTYYINVEKLSTKITKENKQRLREQKSRNPELDIFLVKNTQYLLQFQYGSRSSLGRTEPWADTHHVLQLQYPQPFPWGGEEGG